MILILLLLFPSSALGVQFLKSCPDGIGCLRKCCPFGMKASPNGCIPGGNGLDLPNGTSLVHDRPNCEMYLVEEKYILHHNGTLILEYDEDSVVTREFCVEEDDRNNTSVYTCFPPEDEEVKSQEAVLEVYSWGLFFSVPFLFVTVVVYASFQRLKNLHGRCVLNHTSCMLIAYIILGLLQKGYLQDDTSCILVGYAIQFFFMATFFWLNVMCFDIYWAFSGLRNLTGSVRERERKKLILYSIYAWCTPLLILVITVAVDLSPWVSNKSIFKPQVGVDKCFFKENVTKWIYFYLPMALIILSNIFLFAVTAYRIWSHRKETAVLKKVDSRKHDNTNDKESLIYIECEEQNYLPWYTEPKTSTEKYLFSLYLKLFVVMGINWVMELLSSIVGGPGYLWYIPDFTNTLQGVFIFLIFVWKKRVRRLVWAKICACFGKKPVISSTRTNWSGSTRNTNSTDSARVNSVRLNPTNSVSQTTLP